MNFSFIRWQGGPLPISKVPTWRNGNSLHPKNVENPWNELFSKWQKEGQRKWDCPEVVFSVLPSPFEGESVLIFEQFPRDHIGEHPCVSQGRARSCLLLYCKIFLRSPSSFTPLGSQQRWTAIWLTEKCCSSGERCFLIEGRPGNQPSASLEGGQPPAALLPNTFFSEFPWSSAFPGGRRRPPSPEGFKVYSTRSEVSAFLCSAQSPVRALGSGRSQGPWEAKTESWLPPNLDISATLCLFTPCVPILVFSSPSPHLPL